MGNYRIFIDESCHLENDGIEVMAIGYVKTPEDTINEIKENIKEIKLNHGVPHELKWNTCSNSKLQLYIDLVHFFFESDLTFRTVLVKYKQNLDHHQFNQGSHDNFYYKMVYTLLNNHWINPATDRYKVFLDIKDTRGRDKLQKITEVFNNYHNGESPFQSYQHIRSNESVFIQLADIFIGAITYKSRRLHKSDKANAAKVRVIEEIERLSGYSIDEGTEPWESKFNIFDHQPKKSI